MWVMPEAKDLSQSTGVSDEKPNLVSDGCASKVVSTCTFILIIQLKGKIRPSINATSTICVVSFP